MKLLGVVVALAAVGLAAARSCKNRNTCFHGDCIDIDNEPGFRCECAAGYTGKRCEIVQTPQNWIEYNDGCEYLAVQQPVLKWGDAEEACKRSGARLAKIDSEELNTFLGLIQPDDRNEVERWIGLKRNKLNEFFWSDGTALDRQHYQGWFPNQPGAADESLQCVQAETIDGVTGWQPTKCKEEQRYICQRCPSTTVSKKRRRRRRRRTD